MTDTVKTIRSDIRAVSAHTTESNTHDSDLQARVWHTVTDSAGVEHQVFAKDPMDAIDVLDAKLMRN